jgi:hypothetical protein
MTIPLAGNSQQVVARSHHASHARSALSFTGTNTNQQYFPISPDQAPTLLVLASLTRWEDSGVQLDDMDLARYNLLSVPELRFPESRAIQFP